MKTEDRGEHISLMEPLLVSDASRLRNELADLAVELTAKSTALRKKLNRMCHFLLVRVSECKSLVQDAITKSKKDQREHQAFSAASALEHEAHNSGTKLSSTDKRE